MNPRTIHETGFSDIVDFIKNGIKIADDSISKVSNKTDISKAYSLARATSALTLVCPNLISESLSIDTDIMINKAIERKWVSMLQIALSAFNMSGTSSNAIDFIKDFHTNVNANKLDLDDFMTVADDIYSQVWNESVADINYGAEAAIIEDCRKNIDFYFEDDINESSIARFSYRRHGLEDTIVENDVSILREAKLNPKDQTSTKTGSSKKHDGYESDQSEKNRIDLLKNQILSSDVKKVNELVPSMMIINFMIKDPTGEMKRQQSTIGVKCKMYPVNSNEMVNKIVSKHVDSNILLKLVKVGTREISFFKDFLLAIDGAKINALSKSKRGSSSKLFKVLERRALGGKVRKTFGSVNNCKPIFSLVISREEADYMLNYNDVDVDNPRVVIPIMEKLNLMYFVIVDESNETAKFLLDGDTNYETLSFSALEKETNDGGYKKVVNLMSKMSR